MGVGDPDGAEERTAGAAETATLHLAHGGARTRPGQCEQYRRCQMRGGGRPNEREGKREGGKDRTLLDNPITR